MWAVPKASLSGLCIRPAYTQVNPADFFPTDREEVMETKPQRTIPAVQPEEDFESLMRESRWSWM
jgi:hypothetical protein